MKNSLKNTVALGSLLVGTSVTVANCVSIGANTVAPYDNGRIATKSAVANVLGVDVAYDPRKDPKYNPASPGQSYRENMFSDDATSVRVKSDAGHNQWHKPDTLKEEAAVRFGPNTVAGIGGLISAAAMAAITYMNAKKKNKNKG